MGQPPRNLAADLLFGPVGVFAAEPCRDVVAGEREEAVGDPKPLGAGLGAQDRSHVVVHDLDVPWIKRVQSCYIQSERTGDRGRGSRPGELHNYSEYSDLEKESGVKRGAIGDVTREGYRPEAQQGLRVGGMNVSVLLMDSCECATRCGGVTDVTQMRGGLAALACHPFGPLPSGRISELERALPKVLKSV
jgi:hypothetical protein